MSSLSPTREKTQGGKNTREKKTQGRKKHKGEKNTREKKKKKDENKGENTKGKNKGKKTKGKTKGETKGKQSENKGKTTEKQRKNKGKQRKTKGKPKENKGNKRATRQQPVSRIRSATVLARAVLRCGVTVGIRCAVACRAVLSAQGVGWCRQGVGCLKEGRKEGRKEGEREGRREGSKADVIQAMQERVQLCQEPQTEFALHREKFWRQSYQPHPPGARPHDPAGKTSCRNLH